MELFTYVRMGGKESNIVVQLLGDGQAIRGSLVTLDVSKANCFVDADRQRLLAVIEATFGTFSPFNKLVRELFKKQLRSSNLLPGSSLAADETKLASVSV